MAKPNCAPETVANLAGRILTAWKGSPGTSLQEELDYATNGAPRAQQYDTLEMEKMEVLEGAAESLRCGHQGRVRAAVQVLEHLVRTGGSEFSR
jgi:hypothetical protein